jgi:hypothetical protein
MDIGKGAEWGILPVLEIILDIQYGCGILWIERRSIIYNYLSTIIIKYK